jgi:UDP-2,3-diacylglucosamine pyrophosphatase LpxH
MSADDYIVKNAETIAHSCKSIINTCNKVVVVVSGDIIDKGKVVNYDIAKKFFNDFKIELQKEAVLESYEYVFVPGNHDIDFTLDNQVRPVIIDKIQNRDVVEEEMFVQICLKPQEAFWEFVSEMNASLFSPCVSYPKSVVVNERCNLVFHCYNTALMSTINEKPQSLLVPENFFLYNNAIDDTRKDVVISVFHHKTGWLSTRTANNNQRTFEDHVEHTSNILMCGHEHQKSTKVISNLENVDKILYIECNSLQQGKDQSFMVSVLDDETEEMTIRPYEIFLHSDGSFDQVDMGSQNIMFKKHSLSFTSAHNDFLSRLDAPIQHPIKKDLTLDDIYIYPDLEPMSSLDNQRMYTYVDADNLLKSCAEGQVIFIEGDPQSGKTSLLKMLIRQCYQNGVYPLFVKGQNVKIVNLGGVLSEAYKNQYVADKMDYDQFLQLEKTKRCVFIDNIDRSTLNQEGIAEAFKKVLKNYEFIIVTSNTDNSIIGLLQKSRNDDKIKRYLIHQLGHFKRNKLIERWLLLGADKYSIDANAASDKIKIIFEQFSNILGKQLLPSNPIFLLILLQEMNESLESYDVAPTSYANLYQSLLMSALHKQNVPQSNFDGIIQFLSGMAYSLYKNRKDSFRYDYDVNGEKGYVQSYDAYIKIWNLPYKKEKLLDILSSARLLVEKEAGVYSFAYKYIYFYLVAKHIVSLDGDEKKKEIKCLCEKLYKEENGNILVFMAYLDKDLSLIEEIKFASWLPFENLTPITLDQGDAIYKQLADFVQEVKKDVLRVDVDHKKERENMLKERDEEERAKEAGKAFVPTEEDYEKDKDLREIYDTLKANRIIGQVIKNQRDILKKDQIADLLTDAYLSTFRVLSFFTNLLEKDRDSIVNAILEQNENVSDMDKQMLTDKIRSLLQMMLLRLCYDMFANLSASVGTAGIGDIYDKVSKEIIKSPAADVITFTIKSYYEPLKDSDLQDIITKHKNNLVVLNIVRARVRSYVYNHNLDFRRVQRLGDISGLVLLNSPGKALSNKQK